MDIVRESGKWMKQFVFLSDLPLSRLRAWKVQQCATALVTWHLLEAYVIIRARGSRYFRRDFLVSYTALYG